MKGLSKGTKQVFGGMEQESWHPGPFRGIGTPVSWGNGSERRDVLRRKGTLAKLSHSLEPALTATTCQGRKMWGITSFGAWASSEHFLGLLSQDSLRDEQKALAGSGHRYEGPDPVTPRTPNTRALGSEGGPPPRQVPGTGGCASRRALPARQPID